MAAEIVQSHPNVHDLTKTEAWAFFDQQARRYLNMSGEDFIRRWEAGEFDEEPDQPEVVRVAMLLPLVR